MTTGKYFSTFKQNDTPPNYMETSHAYLRGTNTMYCLCQDYNKKDPDYSWLYLKIELPKIIPSAFIKFKINIPGGGCSTTGEISSSFDNKNISWGSKFLKKTTWLNKIKTGDIECQLTILEFKPDLDQNRLIEDFFIRPTEKDNYNRIKFLEKTQKELVESNETKTILIQKLESDLIEKNKEKTVIHTRTIKPSFEESLDDFMNSDLALKQLNLESLENAVKTIKEEIIADTKCVVCFQGIKSMAFGCNHRCFCESCSNRLDKCPICRNEGTKHKVY